MKLLLTVSYLGTAFHGYQVQKNKRTVQGELNSAAKALFGFECDITGCSRTDAGVHANQFCASVTEKGSTSLKIHIAIDKIPMALNSHLPMDLSVMDARWVEDDFHPRYDVKYKEYVYRIYTRRLRSPFEEGRAWHIPRPIFTDENIEKMNVAATAFVGQHDFSAFMASGSTVGSTVRNVLYAKVEKEGDILLFRVAADGFLYNMVRIMTGTLIGVAQGNLLPEEMPQVIASCDRSRAGVTAPAEGLYLNRVFY